MKLVFLSAALAATLVSCASAPPLPSGWTADKFLNLSCSGGKAFQARMAEDGKSVRVRAHPGSAELDAKGQGTFEGSGYKLTIAADGMASLDHEGKSQGKDCRVRG